MSTFDRVLTAEQSNEILKSCNYGVLSTVDELGEPYGVGVNCFYVEEDHALYFHTKKNGKKIENIKHHPNVSLFITDGMQKIVQEQFTTHYQSIIVEGIAELITDPAQVATLLRLLCIRLCPDALNRREEVIDKYLNAVGICRISIKNITRKANRDL